MHRHELSEDDYRVVSRYSKEIKAAFFQSSWFTEEEVLALLEKTLEIWRCINLVHMVWNNVVEQTGDALGYEVEFMSRRSILSRFGENGITKFALDCNGSHQ